ncbi:MAG: hypothetical protein DMD35_21550 [Gemmatimonadetes bacterium]|nr:MAG: hypothetical protein DMD35_21550 [Gemmatimonadota bacterium]
MAAVPRLPRHDGVRHGDPDDAFRLAARQGLSRLPRARSRAHAPARTRRPVSLPPDPHVGRDGRHRAVPPRPQGMGQVRAQRTPAGAGRGDRMRRLATSGRRALLLACLAFVSTSASASAQQVRQQSVTPAFDVDSAMAYATLLRRQNRKAEAERVMAKVVAVAPARADARALHDLLVHEIRGGEAMLGANVKSWREQLPEWREGSAWMRQNTGHGPVAARLSHVERGLLSDERLEVEAYPAFPHGYLALGAGLATSSTVYAHATGSAELYGSLTEQIEASLGYRHMQFDEGVDMVGGSLGTYLGAFLLGSRVTHIVRDGGTYRARRRHIAGAIGPPLRRRRWRLGRREAGDGLRPRGAENADGLHRAIQPGGVAGRQGLRAASRRARGRGRARSRRTRGGRLGGIFGGSSGNRGEILRQGCAGALVRGRVNGLGKLLALEAVRFHAEARKRGGVLSGSRCSRRRATPRHPHSRSRCWGWHPCLPCAKTCPGPPAVLRVSA